MKAVGDDVRKSWLPCWPRPIVAPLIGVRRLQRFPVFIRRVFVSVRKANVDKRVAIDRHSLAVVLDPAAVLLSCLLKGFLGGGHADTALLDDACFVASHFQSTPFTFFREAAAMTPSQWRGEMLSRSRIWRAASYPQPTSAANSPMVSHSSIKPEMEEGALLMPAIVQKVRRFYKPFSYTLHDHFRP